MPKTQFVYVTFIRATRDQVFEAITRPDIARRYWGHENCSDWQPGSRWEHVRDNAERSVQLAGRVLESDPPARLVLSWSNASQLEDPAQASRVTFDLVTYDGMTRLTVTHDELEPGSGMEAGMRRGWPLVLSSLKSYLETGEGIDVFARPLDPAA